MTNRWETTTVAVPTEFGTLYRHLNHAGPTIIGQHTSQHGKVLDTTLGRALEALDAATNVAIADINRRWNE